MMTKNRIALGFLLSAALGCGDSGPPLAPVHGRVTLNGKPLIGKTLKFIPEPGTPGLGAGASTDKDGKYTLLAVRAGSTSDRPGTPPGKYRVIVNEPMFPIDLPVQDSDNPEPTPAIGVPQANRRRIQAIPPIYSNPETTPLRADVPEDGGEINLKLSTVRNAMK